jgi:ABC-type protease/lipase transport system fused ATPase/permease subunit
VAAWPDADRGQYVGYLPQTVELFAGTVRDNVARLGEATDEAVIAAAQLAAAHETILGLPSGYDTPIGDGGVPISGGQRQRVALARALFGNPALVVLDEPNAHLDGDGEQALAGTLGQLRERGCTVVLISQRAGVMALVDKVMVLKAGAIDAFGTRDEILRTLRRANIAAVGARA